MSLGGLNGLNTTHLEEKYWAVLLSNQNKPFSHPGTSNVRRLHPLPPGHTGDEHDITTSVRHIDPDNTDLPQHRGVPAP